MRGVAGSAATAGLAGARAGPRTAGLTPLTTESGEWLEHHIDKSPLVEEHAELGDTMVYFALALLVAAILLTVQHVRAKRDRPFSAALSAAIAVFVLIAGVATSVQVFRDRPFRCNLGVG